MRDLQLENRALRRAAVQLRITAAATADALADTEARISAGQDEATAAAAAEAEGLALARLSAVLDQNERLMDLSNEMRAERDRLAGQLAEAGAGRGAVGVTQVGYGLGEGGRGV